MNDTICQMTPQQAWEFVLGQIQFEMPRASFETWVRDTRVLQFDEQRRVLTIGARNAYACAWLQDRLSSTVSKLVAGILNIPSIMVEFVVDETHEIQDITEEEVDEGSDFSAEVVSTTCYTDEVHPNRVVVIPGYALRLLEHGDLTPKEMSLWLGFRQAVYRQWKDGQATVKDIPYWEVIRFAMMSKASFFRELAKDTLAGGMIERLPVRRRPYEKKANRYRVHMDPPLTRRDCSAIASILISATTHAATHQEAHQAVYEAITRMLAMSPARFLDLGEETELRAWDQDKPCTVIEIVRSVLGIENDIPQQLADAAERLYLHIITAFGNVVITHYFLTTAAPAMGLTHPQAWAIIMLRDRCWFDHQTRTQYNYAIVPGGVRSVASWVGVTRKTINNWLEKPEFLHFVRLEGPAKELLENGEYWENADVFWVNHQEPLFDNDNSPADTASEDAVIQGEDETREKVRHEPEKVRHGNGKNETQGGKNETREPEKMRHETGKSETHIKLLKPLLNPHKLLKPPPPKYLGLTTARVGLPPGSSGGVVGGWNLDFLLENCRVDDKTRQKIKKLGVGPTVFVSWLLYCASTRGQNIRDPVGYAISKVLKKPKQGAGGAFERLAASGPANLSGLFWEVLASPYTHNVPNDDWRQVMNSADSSRLRMIAECLFSSEKTWENQCSTMKFD